jgi:hypothetical protein
MKKRYFTAAFALFMVAQGLFANGQQQDSGARSSKAVISYGTGQSPAEIHINGNTTGHTIAPGETRELNVAEGRVTVEVVSGSNDKASLAFDAAENITRINFNTDSRPVQSHVIVTHTDGKKNADVSVYINGVYKHTLTGLGDSVNIPVDEGTNTLEIRSRKYSDSIRFTADSNDTRVNFDISTVLSRITRLEISGQTKKTAYIITGLAIAGTEPLPARVVVAPEPSPATTASPAQPSAAESAQPRPAQTPSYYVSAVGNDDNDGLSEDRPLKQLFDAVYKAKEGTVKKITVIGTLNETSETMSVVFKILSGSVFNCSGSDENTAEITITGKPGATGVERAVLSAKGSQAGVVRVSGGIQIRFEHIEISGGENTSEEKPRAGIEIIGEGTRITLGPGAVVRGNESYGITIANGGSCVIDGGEIRDNAGTGIGVLGALTLRNGTIANNKSTRVGGGVLVGEGGIFTMSGGSITGNTATNGGGGVAVMKGGIFNQTSGSVSGNQAPSTPNIGVAEGATANIPR